MLVPYACWRDRSFFHVKVTVVDETRLHFCAPRGIFPLGELNMKKIIGAVIAALSFSAHAGPVEDYKQALQDSMESGNSKEYRRLAEQGPPADAPPPAKPSVPGFTVAHACGTCIERAA